MGLLGLWGCEAQKWRQDAQNLQPQLQPQNYLQPHLGLQNFWRRRK